MKPKPQGGRFATGQTTKGDGLPYGMRFWLCVAFTALPLAASSPAFWEMASYQDFIKGKLDGLSGCAPNHNSATGSGLGAVPVNCAIAVFDPQA